MVPTITKSLNEIAYTKIKNDIITCAYQPGELLSVSNLVDKYKIGRSPINNAFQKLSNEKLVYSIPRVGFCVTPITFEDVLELYEARALLEVNINALAAKKISKEKSMRIMEFAEFQYVHGEFDSYENFLEKNKTFHKEIAICSENVRLAQILGRTLDDLHRVFYLGLEVRDSAEEMRKEHIDLAMCLVNKDVEKIKEVTANQINRSQARVIEAIERITPRVRNIYIRDLIEKEAHSKNNLMHSHKELRI